MRPLKLLQLLSLSTSILAGCVDAPQADDASAPDDEPTASTTSDLRFDQGAVPIGTHTGTVRVVSTVAGQQVVCSGTLISNDTVLTPAHCVCKSGTCLTTNVKFSSPWDPSLTNNVFATPIAMRTDGQVDYNDIAALKLQSPAPSTATPYAINQTWTPTGNVYLLGTSLTAGTTCSQAPATPNVDYELSEVTTAVYARDFDMASSVVVDDVSCPGDAGAPVVQHSPNVTVGNSNFLLGMSVDSNSALTLAAGNEVMNFVRGTQCHSTAQESCAVSGSAGAACSCTASTSIVFENSGTNAIAIWGMSGTGLIQDLSSPGALPSGYQLMGIGDFEGDHHQDLFLRNSAGQNWIIRMNGSGGLISSQAVGGVLPSLAFAGVGDFDGDGISDVLFRNSATNQLVTWRSANPVTQHTVTYYDQNGTLDPAWQVIGTGDFNGDGKADVLWRNTSSNAVAIWYLNAWSMFGDAYPYSAAAGEFVAGIGDFNGDAKADVLWRNAQGGLRIAFAGTARTAGPSWQNQMGTDANNQLIPAPISFQYKVVGVADQNHDGRADIIWSDTSNGQIDTWFMDGIRYTTEVHEHYPNETDGHLVSSDWVPKGLVNERGF